MFKIRFKYHLGYSKNVYVYIVTASRDHRMKARLRHKTD